MKYLDSNMLLYAVLDPAEKGEWSRKLMQRIEDGQEQAATSALTFDEFFWKVKKMKGYETACETTEALFQFPNLRFLDVTNQILWSAFDLIKRYRLDPRDALHAASAIEHGIFGFVSEDRDFDRITEINREWLELEG